MDDNKEKLPNENPENGSTHDEMEELAKIFKEELDKAVREAEDAAVMDDIDKIEVEGYDPKALSRDETRKDSPEQLCECCGERPRGTEKDPDSPFCSECEALLEKYPYDWKGILAVIAVVGVTLAAVFCFMLNTPLFASMKQGDRALSDGKLYTAESKYDNALNFLPEGKENAYLGLFAKRIAVENNLLKMNSALSEKEDYFSDFTLRLPMFRNVKKLGTDMQRMQASASAIQQRIDSKYEEINNDNYDEAIALLDSLSGKKVYVKGDTVTDETDTEFTPDGSEEVFVYDEGWLNIYKYSMAQLCKKDDAVISGFLEKARESSEYMRRLVNPLLAATYTTTGNFDRAAEIAEEIKKDNAESENYYLITSMLYRYRDKDYKKGADICDEGIKMLSQLPNGETMEAQLGDVLAVQKTLNLIMLGDYKSAYEAAKVCYDYQAAAYALSLEARDLYAMLALATGDNDTFKTLEDEIKQYSGESIEFSSDVTDYKAGKITLQEIAESGRYDLI